MDVINDYPFESTTLNTRTLNLFQYIHDLIKTVFSHFLNTYVMVFYTELILF